MANINVLGHLLLRRPLKNLSDKILLDNNMNHPLKKRNPNNVYNKGENNFLDISSFSFSYYPCSSQSKFFNDVLSSLQNINFNFSENV